MSNTTETSDADQSVDKAVMMHACSVGMVKGFKIGFITTLAMAVVVTGYNVLKGE